VVRNVGAFKEGWVVGVSGVRGVREDRRVGISGSHNVGVNRVVEVSIVRNVGWRRCTVAISSGSTGVNRVVGVSVVRRVRRNMEIGISGARDVGVHRVVEMSVVRKVGWRWCAVAISSGSTDQQGGGERSGNRVLISITTNGVIFLLIDQQLTTGKIGNRFRGVLLLDNHRRGED
jgi:hypothetical protein